MGYPIFIQYGNECDVICAGAVRRFPVGETPHWVFVRFSGLRHAGGAPCVGTPNPPINSYFHLEQDPLDSCRWEFDDGLWNVEWSPGKPANQHSYLNLTHVPSGTSYFYTIPGALGTCVSWFANSSLLNPPFCAFGGKGEVAFQAEPYDFLFTKGLCPVDNFYAAMTFHKPNGRMYMLKNRETSSRFTFTIED